jgi:8-oxo-dGTP pyrophosphatase MutT (NUDIX family)
VKDIIGFNDFLFEYAFDNSHGAQFWGDRGAGILPLCVTTGRCLLAMRSQDVNEPGTWGLLGGKMDPGDGTPEEAAMRELAEEAEYKGKVELVEAATFKHPSGHFTYHNFVGRVWEEFVPVLNWETEGTAWITLSELSRLRPKHFGLSYLLDHSLSLIRRCGAK